MMVDLTAKMRNNESRVTQCVVATLNFKIPGTATQANPSGDTVVTAESYAIGKIPAGAVVTNVSILQTIAFDSVTSIACAIGVTGALTLYAAAYNGKTAADTVTAGTAGPNLYYGAATDIILTPTIVGATTVGELKVLVEYIEPAQRTGSYTA